MRTVPIVNCDLCGKAVSGDNSDSWAGQLPMPSVPPTKDELKKNPELKREKYSITHTDICSPCVEVLGNMIQEKKSSGSK
jgi:hypothetical protein